MGGDNRHSGEVLVAILNNYPDFQILQEQGWYRVPVQSAPKRWPPKWLAFYQTKVFKEQAYSVQYYGKVVSIETVKRTAIFPNEPPNPKSERLYYRLHLEKLEQLETPILSSRRRRLVFIPTTWAKFKQARELNDLYDDSPLEDNLWHELKKQSIPAERQWWLAVNPKARYALDFALFCCKGFINVETDGDTWHACKERIARDNQRDNHLAQSGWRVLRFNGQQIREHLKHECIPTILETINYLGGLSDEGLVPRTFYSTSQGSAQQLTLFEDKPNYNDESNDLDASLDSGADYNLE